MSTTFKRVIEDFICEHCGAETSGDGYTNHCPKCLYSLHVDVNPGDRANGCGGLMEPVAVEYKSSGSVITHRCLKCGTLKNNKSAKDDNMNVMLELMRRSGLHR
jgi:rubrerythrin